MQFLLEACVDTVESAIEAKKGGANRLELCSNLLVGGTSPSLALYELVKATTGMKVHVLIRPRSGDFCYTDYEFQVMKREIEMFKEVGAEGVVIGVLQADGMLDINRMQELIARASGMHITLHRAFDMTEDPYRALENAKALGVHTILTSGQKNHCMEGVPVIQELVKRSDQYIDIMVGSGVNADNIDKLVQLTGAHTFHLSGKKNYDSPMTYRKKGLTMGIDQIDEYARWETDSEKIHKVHMCLKNRSIL
jgi:copper homeostasis protein